MIKILDFYSGIGGFHQALHELGMLFQIIGAFDMNENANKVYQQNFGISVSKKNIGHLVQHDIDGVASMWLCSPPCQPYSRKGERKTNDARSDSFTKLLHLLRTLDMPPEFIMIENVLGLEKSEIFPLICSTFLDCGYTWQAFIVNPKNHGFPYSRPRLFILARRCSAFAKPEYNTKIQDAPGDIIPIIPSKTLDSFLDDGVPLEEYKVIENDLWKAGGFYDIVTPNDIRSCCITKSYGNFAKGGGSILSTCATANEILDGQHCFQDLYHTHKTVATTDGPWWKDLGECPLTKLNARYFTPREIARIHGFPESYKISMETLTKQWYKLLGNSLHVTMVKYLLEYLVADGHSL